MKDLLKQLVQANSTSEKGESAAAEVIAGRFARHGIDCRIDHWDTNRANIIAQVKSAGKRPALLFVCHLDVVGPGQDPWEHPPFDASEENGRVYGRGTTDMKGGIASVVAAMCELVDAQTDLQGDILFAATAGEETDSAGVVRLVGQMGAGSHACPTDSGQPQGVGDPKRIMSRLGTLAPAVAGVVIPEPTDFAVVTAHRGLFWLKITTRGKAVHSSMPERGVNAILSMKRVLDELEQYRIPFAPHPLLGACSMSINTISSPEVMNMVPDRCTLGVDIRTLPGQDHDALRYDFERILAKLKAGTPQFDADLTVERAVKALETDSACEFVKKLCSAVGVDLTNVVAFTTDAPHLAPLGAPIVIYGPGKSKMCHQVDEYIEIADLRKGADLFKNIILTFLT
jgi:succinyl-diaminopimelate desuccinylase